MSEALTAETTELLQTLIRNRCVNDGDVASGQEVRNCDVLTSVIEGAGLDFQTYEPEPGRRSLLTTIEGTDPEAPTLLLMGHTDVVPVSEDEWQRDPFGGELVDGEVWGRGAIDMLNLTSSMAVAVRHLAREGRRPARHAEVPRGRRRGGQRHLRGPVADRAPLGRGGGRLRAHRVRRRSRRPARGPPAGDRHQREGAGLAAPGDPRHAGPRVDALGHRQRAADRGRGGAAPADAGARRDASATLGAPSSSAMGLPEEFDEILLDPGRVREAFELLDEPTARYCHAATHTTFSPNVLHGGTKTNVIPDRVELDVDVRTLPGVSSEDVDAMFADLLGDLGDRVEVTAPFAGREATQSPTDTPLYEALCRRVEAAHPGASAAPWMNVGATDAAFFRQRGVVAYGAGLFGPNTSLQEFSSRFHGHDERVDVDSLGLSTQLWLDLVDDLLT
jgi:acetylornithine deacetylase/succinyl-diaminopimelate desuccinylase-like protein